MNKFINTKLKNNQPVKKYLARDFSSSTSHKKELIEDEIGFSGGPINVSNAFDLSLLKLHDGNYELQLSMCLEFRFYDEHGNTTPTWTFQLKEYFMNFWNWHIKSIWDNLLLRNLSNGKVVLLTIQINYNRPILNHWKISVRSNTNFRSNVMPNNNTVNLKHYDISYDARTIGRTSKGDACLVHQSLTEQKKTVRSSVVFDNQLFDLSIENINATKTYENITSAHEFGHMIGIKDDYGPLFGGSSNAHKKDYDSIMNIGSKVRQRHLLHIQKWLTQALAKHNIS